LKEGRFGKIYLSLIPGGNPTKYGPWHHLINRFDNRTEGQIWKRYGSKFFFMPVLSLNSHFAIQLGCQVVLLSSLLTEFIVEVYCAAAVGCAELGPVVTVERHVMFIVKPTRTSLLSVIDRLEMGEYKNSNSKMPFHLLLFISSFRKSKIKIKTTIFTTCFSFQDSTPETKNHIAKPASHHDKRHEDATPPVPGQHRLCKRATTHPERGGISHTHTYNPTNPRPSPSTMGPAQLPGKLRSLRPRRSR
jgi:hypothetical protein